MAEAQYCDVKPLRDDDDNGATVAISYGRYRFGQLATKIQAEDEELREMSLAMLCSYMNAPMQISEGVVDGVVPALKVVLDHPSATSRVKASDALNSISKVPIGRVAIVKHEVVKVLIMHLDDSNPKVKENCYHTLIHLTENQASIKPVLDLNIVVKLINVIETDKVQFQYLALELLVNCQTTRTNEATLQALDARVVQVCLKIIDENNPKLKLLAADNLKKATFPLEGKHILLDNNGIEILMKSIDYDDVPYCINILACLMNLYILNDAKRQYGKNDKYVQWTNMLTSGLKHENNIIQLNTIKLLSSITVCPEVKKMLLKDDTRDQLEKMKCDDELMNQACQTLIDLINWKP